MIIINLCLSLFIVFFGLCLYIPKSFCIYDEFYFNEQFSKKIVKKELNLLALLCISILLVFCFIFPLRNISTYALFLVTFSGIIYFDSKLEIIPDYFHFLGLVATVSFYFLNGVSNLPVFLIERGGSLILPLGLFIINLIYEKTTKKSALGLGDIKLYLWLSILFGKGIFLIFSLSIFLCVISRLIPMRSARSQTFAFGPYIVSAVGIYLFFEKMNLVQFQ